MIFQRVRGLQRVLLFAQCGLVTLLYWALVLALDAFYAALILPSYTTYWLVIIAGMVIELLHRDRARHRPGVLQDGFVREHRVAIRQTLFGLGALLIYLVLAKDLSISRVFVAAFAPALYVLLLASHRHLPSRLAKRTFAGVRQERSLLIGTSRGALRLNEWLARKREFGFLNVGLLCDEDCSSIGLPFPILGTKAALSEVVTREHVTQLIVLELPTETESHADLLAVCERFGIRLLILSDLEERLRHRVINIEDDGLHFIILRQEPLENPLNRLIKRGVDLACSLFVILTVLPFVTLLIWLLQRFFSPGPIFYRQTRAGLQNWEFLLWKFRSMHPNNDDVSRQAAEDDDRIFVGGRWLRKFSLDELPQFLNVLRGDMSVVGPRPHLVEHNKKFAGVMGNYHLRAFVKPGITGLAQVRGLRGEAKTDADIEARVRADIDYLENWTIALDLLIILRTIWQMIRPPKSAY